MRMRNTCINCGIFIVKSAISDPYLCRDCEKLLEGSNSERKYGYLENMH